ncbi:hypothetical protein ACFW04_003171 [Cataglyphis niger]
MYGCAGRGPVGKTREFLHKPSDCLRTVWRDARLIDWRRCWKWLLATPEPQLVGNGLHGATAHVTHMCSP